VPTVRAKPGDSSFLERKLTCLKWLPKSGLLASGLQNKLDGDLVLVKPDQENFRFKYREFVSLLSLRDRENFSQNMRVNDVVELDVNSLLVMTTMPTEFFHLTVETKGGPGRDRKSVTRYLKGGGFGTYGFSANPLTNYNSINYPYALIKEDSQIWVFDPPKNTLSHSLVKFKFSNNPRYMEQHLEINDLQTNIRIVFDSL
jgi:hypothetical protein